VITECSIQTTEGVKVADATCALNKFIDTYAYETPYSKAPETCIKIVSPSNSKEEIMNKISLHLTQDTKKVG
jgi:hypothetical protein